MDPRSRSGDATASPPATDRRRRGEGRVSNACDLCKSRKVKCDGKSPCAYCISRSRASTCRISGPKTQQRNRQTIGGSSPQRLVNPQAQNRANSSIPLRSSHSEEPAENHEDRQHTAVPLEARLLRDTQGKMIFIGDCAPLSFLQTVRQLIATKVTTESLPTQLSRDSVVETPSAEHPSDQQPSLIPRISPPEIDTYLEAYHTATYGLVNFFEENELRSNMKVWASLTDAGAEQNQKDSQSTSSALFYLIIAIGAQERNERKSELWFRTSRRIFISHLESDTTVVTVCGFALISLYMLRSFQPNGAYLNFGLSARSGYAIGLHRTEVSASFGTQDHIMRDQIWKSLRVVDMIMSNILGRPTSTADVDCTVIYDKDSNTTQPFLDATVQILLIIERIVLEVYSRKRISLRIAKYISHQLKAWASKWLLPLKDIAFREVGPSRTQKRVTGALQPLCTYYYAIMLLSRPFLIYRIYEHLGTIVPAQGSQVEHREKLKFADAALDAATSFIETLQKAVQTGILPSRMPMVVSWLFTTSLVLAVGLLGDNGLSLEHHCHACVFCLEHFARVDPHAQQYLSIVVALFRTTRSHAEKDRERILLDRRRASAKLFGLFPDASDDNHGITPSQDRRMDASFPRSPGPGTDPLNGPSLDAADWNIDDNDLFALPWLNENVPDLQDFLQPGVPSDDVSLAQTSLFPMYDRIPTSLDPSLSQDTPAAQASIEDV